jgi:membrane protease YdiL (CAAX protease family)
MEAPAATGSSLGFVLLIWALIAVAAALAVLTVRGRLRRLWLNRHGLLRVVWRLVIFTLLLAAIGYGVMYGTAVLLVALNLSDGSFALGEGPLQVQIIGYLFMTLAIFALSAIAVRLFDRRAIAGLGLGFHSCWLKQFSIGLMMGMIFVTTIVAVQMATGTLHLQPTGIDVRLLVRSFLLTLVVCIGVAFLEELVFRGYFLQVLAEGIGDFVGFARRSGAGSIRSQEFAGNAGKIVASVVLAAPFGLAHYFNAGGTFVGAVVTGMGGLVLSLAYFRTRSLWTPVGLHITWNLFMGWIFSVPVSGELLETIPFTGTVSGPEWFTGGSFGPEGSILAVIALACMAVFMARSRHLEATPDAMAWYTPQEARVASVRVFAEVSEDVRDIEPPAPEPDLRLEGRDPTS